MGGSIFLATALQIFQNFPKNRQNKQEEAKVYLRAGVKTETKSVIITFAKDPSDSENEGPEILNVLEVREAKVAKDHRFIRTTT